MRPVLVVITSDGCDMCKDYKVSEKAKLERLLQVDARVDIVRLEAESDFVRKQVIYHGDNYHPDLKDKYACWYPNFILCTTADWRNHKEPLNGIIYGGDLLSEINNGTVQYKVKEIEKEYVVKAENIMNWVIDKLNTNKFKTKSIIKYKEHLNRNNRFFHQ